MNTVIDEEDRRARLRSLDGIRGFGAIVVVIGHAVTAYPFMNQLMTTTTPVRETGSLLWWFTHTPLHLPWLGVEFVYMFFLMSGLVLVLPVLRAQQANKPFDWKRYFPRRLARLYLPVWGAIVFTIALMVVIAVVNPGGVVVSRQVELLTPGNIVREFLLVLGSTGINGPLWTLQWEILFSVALPLFIVFAVKWRNLLVLKLVVLFAVVLVGAGWLLPHKLIGEAFFYLPMFALGAVAAVEFDKLEALARRINQGLGSTAKWLIVCVATVVVMCSYWYVLAFSPPLGLLLTSRAISLLGSVSFLFVVLFYGPVKRFFQSRSPQWFGARSFSIYLVHVPILWAINSFLPDELRWLTLVIGLPAAILIGHAFHHAVEVPSHRFAKDLFAVKPTKSEPVLAA
jgi:peptidoglycan/LPS O-acetylase OafA/YrhL